MSVAFHDLVAGLELLGVLVLDPERLADVVDDILIGRGVIAAGRFIPGEVGVLHVHVHVAGRDLGRHAAMFLLALVHLRAAGPGGRAPTEHVQRRGWARYGDRLHRAPWAWTLTFDRL